MARAYPSHSVEAPYLVLLGRLHASAFVRRRYAAAASAEAREHARQQIREAQAAIDQDVAAARQSLGSEAERLASAIIRTILKPAGVASAVGGSS